MAADRHAVAFGRLYAWHAYWEHKRLRDLRRRIRPRVKTLSRFDSPNKS
jgi:hypothetical protein